MIKLIKAGLVGIIIGVILTVCAGVKFWPQPKPNPKPQIITIKEPVISGGMSGQAGIVSPQNDPIKLDFKVVVPVSGEFATKSAEVKVIGETTVERIGDLVSIDTKFHEANIRVKYQPPPLPPRKLWHIGACVYTSGKDSGVGGHIQRDFVLFESALVDAIAFGRVEKDSDTRIKAGVQISF